MPRKVINNQPIGIVEYMKSVYQYRSLILTLIKRDLKAKYAQTALGILWAVIQPLIALVIFSVFFDGLIHLETGDIAYPVFAFSGMIIWYYFSSTVRQSGNALISHQDLIKKVYFPKIILPLYKALVGLFEFGIAFLIFVGLAFLWKTEIHVSILFIPLIILLVTFTGLTISLWLNAFTVKRRDFQHLIPYMVNYGIWLTPVFYPSTIIPAPYTEWIYYLNPVATAIEMFRSATFGTPFEWFYCISFVGVFVFFIAGVYLFKKTERNIADYV
jgi:lipopolysaccharide transport system permease protein